MSFYYLYNLLIRKIITIKVYIIIAYNNNETTLLKNETAKT